MDAPSTTDIDRGTDPIADDRSRIQRATVPGGIEIAYETFGDPDHPAILLVMGLGTQMLGWPDELCEALADAGHLVVRFDNRDVGLSTHVDAPTPSLADLLLRRNTPYSINDMATDAIGLCDALGIERFHLAGASMGGFIAQTIALAVPDRVRSMTLIMTSTGSRRVGRPTPAVLRRMASMPISTTRDQAIEESVETFMTIGSPDHLDRDLVRRLAGYSYDRAHDPGGRQRQLAAILAQPNRTAALRTLRVPTLVVHGLDDPLVTPSGGLALARAIPGATFIGHSGMGHDLPRTVWPSLATEIASLAARAAAAD